MQKLPMNSTRWAWTPYARKSIQKYKIYRNCTGESQSFALLCIPMNDNQWTIIFAGVKNVESNKMVAHHLNGNISMRLKMYCCPSTHLTEHSKSKWLNLMVSNLCIVFLMMHSFSCWFFSIQLPMWCQSTILVRAATAKWTKITMKRHQPMAMKIHWIEIIWLILWPIINIPLIRRR